MKDPELRAVSPAARGLWIDMLCLMFECDRRGYLQFNNGKIVTAEHLARMTGSSTDDTSRWLQELENSGVFSRTDDGTIFSRRMLRDEKERSRVRAAVTKLRCNADVTKSVTDSSVSVSVSPHLEVEQLKPPESSDELLESILKLYPANWHWRNSKTKLQLPQAQCNALIEAIGRSGLDAVLAGTKAYAKYVERSPGFVVRPERFYGNEAHYLKKLEDWESANGTHQQSTKQSRAREVASNNLAAFRAAMGGNSVGASSVPVQGTNCAGDNCVEGEIKRLSE
jgi:hypothetical protein